NSSRASTTSAATAPQLRARSRITAMSSPPWPTSTATATTSAPARSAIQPMATEVSRPPEYASTTRFVITCPLLLSRLVPRRCSRAVAGRAGALPPAPAAPMAVSCPLHPPLRQPEQRLRHLFPSGRVPGDHQDGVVAGDRTEDGGPSRVVDGGCEQLRSPGRGAQHHQVRARLSAHEQVPDPG